MLFRSKLCIPYLRKSKSPHILNISPPLDMDPKWFASYVAYTMSKFGMSVSIVSYIYPFYFQMCVLGMHEELRDDGIAVNALWPRTVIWTAAVSNVVYDDDKMTMDGCRKVEIMADSAYLILQKPKTFTGNFLIDDTFLASEGLKQKDFLKYSYDQCKLFLFMDYLNSLLSASSPQLDFFVPNSYPDPMEGYNYKAKL